MIEKSYYPSVNELMAAQRTRRLLLASLLAAVVLSVFGAMMLMAIMSERMPAHLIVTAGLGIFVALAVPVAIWNNPRLGLYILLACTMVLEAFPMDMQTYPGLTKYIMIWPSINSMGRQFGTTVLDPIKVSAAEVIMLLALLSWLIRSIVKRDLKFEKGVFFWYIAAFMATIINGLVYGIMTGGNSTMALWEVRSLFYFFFVYIMAANLITERKQVDFLLWITIIMVGIRGFLGVHVWSVLGTETVERRYKLLEHTDSLFFTLLFFMAFILSLSNGDKRMKWVTLLLIPVAIFSTLMNQRRAGMAAFFVAIIPTIMILYTVLPHRRRQVLRFLVGMAIFNAVYLPVAWNGEGAWALPARSIKSINNPSERDASSDYYRLMEDTNLKLTRDIRPLLGVGFGIPFGQFLALPRLTTDFLQYMPHNSVLWIWMRVGHIGFFCFLLLIGVVLVKGIHILKEIRSPSLMTVGVLAVSSTIMMFAFAKYDLQLCNPRTMVMVAVFVGVLGVLPKLQAQESEREAKETQQA
jgi:hypothetical protein